MFYFLYCLNDARIEDESEILVQEALNRYKPDKFHSFSTVYFKKPQGDNGYCVILVIRFMPY